MDLKTRALGLAVVMGIVVAAGSAKALTLGSNITVYDNYSSGTGWYGPQEDQETEPGTITSQTWDQEGMYLYGGNTLKTLCKLSLSRDTCVKKTERFFGRVLSALFGLPLADMLHRVAGSLHELHQAFPSAGKCAARILDHVLRGVERSLCRRGE